MMCRVGDMTLDFFPKSRSMLTGVEDSRQRDTNVERLSPNVSKDERHEKRPRRDDPTPQNPRGVQLRTSGRLIASEADTEKCFFLIYKTEMKMVMVGLAAEGKTTTSCKPKLDVEPTTIVIIGDSF